MKLTIYKCDTCYKTLSDIIESVAVEHLSIDFDYHSGWVDKSYPTGVGPSGLWKHISPVNGIKQFCNEKCLAKYFKVLRVKKNA